ncbi:cyclic nucleotide-binding domain-containing protein [Nocardioides sp.]|uniref:cyclic nucleotide-binding domain-containing protein n=1 Tax=Nocardioides sp. TaxID=35761 RepID=UPI001A1C7775|nr:cyclic nucleotide-binding domain-containing protein [Nocardioides sp.]MBJ7356279.1 cyclic nucleotide-binding domain-containing protein [Nocardioides sp.]
MTVQTIAQYLPEHPFFAGLDPATLELAAGCAVNVHFRPGAVLFREGDPADVFYVLRSGRVSIQMRTPTEGVLLDTAHAGDVVGWSWLVPPYRWTFDALATEDTSAIAFDGACLRGKCENDAALGYALLQRVVQVMSGRLHSARVRLLDLYGVKP